MLKTVLFWILCVVFLAGCGGDSVPTNTGFNGTWYKETSSLKIYLYIWDDGAEHRFRMFRQSTDGTGLIQCDWDGNCQEFVKGNLVSEFRFRLEEAETGDSLFLHLNGVVLVPEEFEISYIHELQLSEDGLTLLSYTVESQGIRSPENARGMRTMEKVSDKVPEPPSKREAPVVAE